MYLPNNFKQERPELLHALMRARPLATLVTTGKSGLTADHLPVEFLPLPSGSVIRGHVARANPVWRDYVPESEALVIFHGPDAYVSPSLYPTKAANGEVVPTWNYAVVHARGVLSFTHDAQWLHELVSRLTDAHEASRGHPWKVGDAPTAYMGKMLTAIVGFELAIVNLSGKWKVSQNRSTADQQGVISGLQLATDADSQQIAAMLAETQAAVSVK